MSQWYKRRKYYKSQNYKILVCDNAEYEEQNYKKDTTKWKVSWEPKSGVSKTAGKTTGQKSIAEQLKITLSIPKRDDDDHRNECDECDEFEKEEAEHETKRNKSKGKSGLMGKGCLLDASALFGE